MLKLASLLFTSMSLLISAPVFAETPEPTPAPTVSSTVEYWVVTGRVQSGAEPSLPPALMPIASALEGRPKGMKLELLEKVAISTNPGESAKLKGGQLSVSQTFDADGDELVLSAHISLNGPNELTTRVRIKPRRPTLIGESALVGKDRDTKPAALFYVVVAK